MRFRKIIFHYKIIIKKKMNSKFLAVFILIISLSNITKAKTLAAKKLPSIDCDSLFRDVIEIDKQMINHLHDHNLKYLYANRDSNFDACFGFYTKLLNELNEFLASIDDEDDDH